MDAKFAEMLCKQDALLCCSSNIVSEIKERGFTISNLLTRAERMHDEVGQELDYHTYSGVIWNPERGRCGLKKWESTEACSNDLMKLSELKARVHVAMHACDEKMRFDLSFDDMCSALERTANELEALAQEPVP